MNREETPFQTLLDRVLDGTADDARRQQISDLVEEQHGLIDEIVEQMRVHSLLQWQCGSLKNTNADLAAPRSGKFSKTIADLVHSSTRRWRWAAVLAVIACGIVAVRRLPVGEVPASIAEIVDEHGVVWSDDNTALKDGKRIVTGRLAMRSGDVTLRFRSGATVSATGDVSMRIASDMLVFLDRGQATAHVPQWAKGFTIKTHSAEVIDLGTKFGVMARDGGTTDVVVFEGQVDLKPISNAVSGLKRLTQGEGARVGNTGAIDRIVEVSRNSRGDRWSTDVPMGGDSVFKSVRDNLHSADSAKFYATVPHGLTDDALAYVDRPHEWNGVTTDGLPKFLEHADYIRTFNETRYFAHLEIVVELARSADVYVFFDSRVPPPRWLQDQFEDIDVQIGLDEGPWQVDDTKHAVGVGGGQSIDTVFTVWRRRCKQGEFLILGPLGERLADCAMYGIAAQPLN